MSIQEIVSVIQQMEGTPPSQSDPNYWAYRFHREKSRRAYAPVNRPNPELETNMRAYWNALLCREEKTW